MFEVFEKSELVPVTIQDQVYKEHLAEVARILYQYLQKKEVFFDKAQQAGTPRPSESKEDRQS